MDILPTELWFYIFEYLDVDSAINVCDVCEYFKNIVFSCRYLHLAQRVDSKTKYFLDCGKYDIYDYLHFTNWKLDMFQWRGLTWDVEVDCISNIKRNLIGVFRDKAVEFYDKLNDYSIISECSEVMFNHPEIDKWPEECEGVENVVIKFEKRYPMNAWFDTYEEYEEYMSRVNSFDLTNLRSSRRVVLENCENYINFDCGFCLSELEHVELIDCENIIDENIEKFRYAKYVGLSYTNIVNVSDLEFAEEVDLSGCDYIRDISSLYNVKRVNLAYCKSIENFMPIANAEFINVAGCKIKDVGLFHRAKILILCNCDDYVGLQYLDDVEIYRWECGPWCKSNQAHEINEVIEVDNNVVLQ